MYQSKMKKEEGKVNENINYDLQLREIVNHILQKLGDKIIDKTN